MSYQCEVIEMEPHRAVAVRTVTTYHRLPKTIGDAFASLSKYLTEHAVFAEGPRYVKYAGQPAHDFPIEVGIPVASDAPVVPGFEAASLPSGRAVTCLHRGHYSDLPHAYRALEKWVSAEGIRLTGEAYELYLNDGEHTPPTAWLTRISMPIA